MDANPNDQTIELVPTGAALGVEIRGLDVTTLDKETFKEIEKAFRQHQVLVFRNQKLTDAQLLEFARYFGELDLPRKTRIDNDPWIPEHPEIILVSNLKDENDKPLGALGAGEAKWHADMTYIDVPPKAAILYALQVPAAGGNTYFANMYAAYEALPVRLKRAIEGRHAIHDAAHNSAGMRRMGYGEITDVRDTPGARHPLVRTNPRTGRRALFLGRRAHGYIVGMEVSESEALLDELWSHAGDLRFAMSHEWRVGDVLIWNNLSVIHRRDPFDAADRRLMHRTQIKGDEVIIA